MSVHERPVGEQVPGEGGVVMGAIHSDDWLTIHGGDNREVMATLPDESVQCVVTSPPYWGLRDYGVDGQLGLEPTPEEYVANMVAVFREVRRVLRRDGTLWLNLGDSYAGSGKGAWGDDAARDANRARVKETYVPTRAESPTAGLVPPGLKPKDLVGIPWRVAFALQADGWYLRSDIIWSKPNPMPESVTDRPTKAHEYLFLLTKSERYHYDADAIREPYNEATLGRYDYAFQGSTSPGRRQPGNTDDRWQERSDHGPNPSGRNRRSVWTIATRPYPGAHFATFPEALVEPCVLAGAPEGSVVLDPFAGTGTVGVVAQRLSRRALLIDLNPDYLRQLMARNADVPLGLVS